MEIPGLIVKKIGMTRMVDAEGRMVPVTLVQAETQKVTQIKSAEKNGYSAVQVGYYEKPTFRLNKATMGRLAKAGLGSEKTGFTRFKEIRLAKTPESVELGTALSISIFKDVQTVDITGANKGRGFQGAIKRHGSARGRMTHGSCYHRRTGSIGSNTSPGRVFKNKKMPGHMGDVKTTVQNLRIMDIDMAANVIALKGSIPGHNNSYLYMRPSIKA